MNDASLDVSINVTDENHPKIFGSIMLDNNY